LGASALSATATGKRSSPGARPEWSSGTVSDEQVKPRAPRHGCAAVRRAGAAGLLAGRAAAVVVASSLPPPRPPPQAAAARAMAITAARRIGDQSRMAGKSTTSRIERLPVSSMTRRSTPMPMPPAGGRPCSSACR
jgi:hypothetical protein